MEEGARFWTGPLLSFNFQPAVSSHFRILHPWEYLIMQFLNRSTVYYLKVGQVFRVSAILFFFFFLITSLVALCSDCLWAVLPKQLMTIDSANHYSLTFSLCLSSHDLAHALFPAFSKLIDSCCFQDLRLSIWRSLYFCWYTEISSWPSASYWKHLYFRRIKVLKADLLRLLFSERTRKMLHASISGHRNILRLHNPKCKNQFTRMVNFAICWIMNKIHSMTKLNILINPNVPNKTARLLFSIIC